MSCIADPGNFCSPLYNRPILCPENWYCPGGLAMARRCPDNRWSAVGSVYPEHCKEYMYVEFTIVLVLAFMALILGVCIWAASWEWDDRTRKQYAYADPLYPGIYVDVSNIHGASLPARRDSCVPV